MLIVNAIDLNFSSQKVSVQTGWYTTKKIWKNPVAALRNSVKEYELDVVNRRSEIVFMIIEPRSVGLIRSPLE